MNKLEIVGFEHLHRHSDFSLLDGFATVEEYAEYSKEANQKYLCITDHGSMGAIPRQIRAAEKNNLYPLYGCELYVNPLQCEYSTDAELQAYIKGLNPDSLKIMRHRGYHLLAIAYNKVGYSNLVHLTSLAWTKGYYYRPRVNHEQLQKYKEGIIFTSCCYASEIGRAFDSKLPDTYAAEEAGYAMIEKYIQMFDKENFYLEIMLLDFVKQKPYDAFIIKAADKYGLKIILTNDCHYCKAEDSQFQRLMLMVQTQNTIEDIKRKMAEEGLQDFFELQDSNLFMKTEEELNAKWEKDYKDVVPYDVFKQAKLNTIEVCRRARGVELDRSIKLPQIPDADLKLKEYVLAGFQKRGLPTKGEIGKKYVERIKEEYSLICHKEFSSYFLIQKQMTDEARRVCRKLLGWGDGSEAVGPGRGCLSGDTKIVMADGTAKPICHVIRGDSVVTVDGTIHEVEKVFEYPVSEDLIQIWSYYGDANGVSLTSDHKVLVEKSSRPDGWSSWDESTKTKKRAWKKPTGNLIWLRADQIEVGDWVFVPRPKLPFVPFTEVDLSGLSGENLRFDECFVYQDWINPLTKIRYTKKLKRRFHMDKDWYTLLGIFVGDGWLRSDNSGRVGFCFTEGDSFGIALLLHKMAELEANCYVVPKYKNKRVTQIHVNSRHIERLFRSWMPLYKCTSQTKHVPSFVFNQTEDLIRAFLRGYHLSDGHESYCNKFTTTSDRLAYEIRFLHWLVNEPASLAEKVRTDPRSGMVSNEKVIKTPRSEGISLTPERKQYTFQQTKDGVLTRVRKIGYRSDVNRVYDLQVNCNHDYMTTSFHVHNSAVGSLICYCLQITDVDPIKHDLLFKRFLSEARGGKSLKLRFRNIDPIPQENL